APMDVDERLGSPSFLDRHDLADEEAVVAGCDAVDSAYDDPADGVGEQAGIVVADGDALPERDRRAAPREVLRQMRLVAPEDRHRPLVRLAQHLVQRRVERDRDADEAWLE